MPAVGQTLHFILNPTAGSGKASAVARQLAGHCKGAGYQIVLHQTTGAGHATVLGSELRQTGDLVLAIGGDGTVSEVAAGLIGGTAVLGIIPCGSGNGLARHLGIPMDPIRALRSILHGKELKADVLYAGRTPFFNIGGIGFDGRIAAAFNAEGKRGLFNYIRLIIREFFNSSEFQYELVSMDFIASGPAFIIAVANGSQYGNNARIASGARLEDGLIKVVVVRKPTLFEVPRFAWQVMTGKVEHSELVRSYACDALRIQTSSGIPLHLDGEAAGQVTDITFRLEPGKLNLMAPAIA